MTSTKLSTAYLAWVRNIIGVHYWGGKFYLTPQKQHVYDIQDVRPEFIHLRVPRLGQAYDLSGFWEYHNRMGWHICRHDDRCHAGRCPPGICIADGVGSSSYGLQTPSIIRVDRSAATCSERIAFLQAWLFSGALAEAHTICNLPINPDDYSEDNFDTGHLNGLSMRLFAAAQKVGHAGSRDLKEKLYALIRHVQLMITRASDWEDEYEYTLEQCEVLFSIHILLRVLSIALLCHSRHPFLQPNDDLKLSVADLAIDWKPEGQMSMMMFTHDRLVRNGWCKSEMWHILQSFDVSMAACYLNRPHAPRSHETCTDTTCMAYQTDESHYRTVHVSENCDCTFVSVEPTELRDILARNTIPKIVISDDLKLSVVDGEKYICVAISHVWADGLGNPFQNALPSCQIRRLRDLSMNLCDKFQLRKRRYRIALWIDTLCIPVAPELKEYRKLAIRLLARTYTEATYVLVLDRELCRFVSRKASVLELGIRVMCSGWLKRLWTLQEASLAGVAGGAGTLYIQMADGPAHWNRLTQSFKYKPSRPILLSHRPTPLADSVQEVKTNLLYGMHLLTAMEDRLPLVDSIQEPRFETRFQKIMSAVQNRSTSKREDEPVCMALLLGLDISQILNIDSADERMIKFFRLLYEIPTAIIFAEFRMPDFRSNKLATSPYRWAPRSLLLLEQPMEINLAFSAMRFAEPPLALLGTCEDDGLHVQHPGFVFDNAEPVVIVRESVLLDTVSGELYSLSLALSDQSPQSVGPVKCCALLFKTEICSDVVITEIESPMSLGAEKRLSVTIIGHATIGLWSGGTGGTGGVVVQPLRGSLTKTDQKWCIT